MEFIKFCHNPIPTYISYNTLICFILWFYEFSQEEVTWKEKDRNSLMLKRGNH